MAGVRKNSLVFLLAGGGCGSEQWMGVVGEIKRFSRV